MTQVADPSCSYHYKLFRNRFIRGFLFRTLAFLLGLFPLIALEIVLRIFISAPSVLLDDPFVSFAGIRPLFVLDDAGTRCHIPEERLTYFRPQSFSAVKEPTTFRIFCLGGSTVQGRPYSVETAFPTWLKMNLQAAQPDITWEVINCGGISYASYRLRPIFSELLQYEPDLFLIYTGHNEFLEDRAYTILKKTPRFLLRLHRVLLGLRSFALANEWIVSIQSGQEKLSHTFLPIEVRTKLDMEEGLESYHRDEVWRQGIIEHFYCNLEIMLQQSRQAHIPVILVNPAFNLKDCPPFKSQFRNGISSTDQKKILERWRHASQLPWSEVQQKLKLLLEAARIDDQHAGLLYRIGRCYHRMGRFEEAKTWFIRAKEQDICPLRIVEPMRDSINKLAIRFELPMVDAQALFEQNTDDGICGDEWLLDHVHPNIEGHQLLADTLLQAMEKIHLIIPVQGWQKQRDDLWQIHLSSLNEAYFMHGTMRLERLRRWSRGHAIKPSEDLPGSFDPLEGDQ